MPTQVTLKGGPELRARLDAISRPFPPIAERWVGKALPDMRSDAPSRTGAGRASIRPGVLSLRPGKIVIKGDFWLIFMDKGTKAHYIRPQRDSFSRRHWITSVDRSGPEKGYGNPKWLKFDGGGGTIFARKVHRRRMRPRPFITMAAQNAIKPPMMSDEIIGLWNRKRQRRGRWSSFTA